MCCVMIYYVYNAPVGGFLTPAVPTSCEHWANATWDHTHSHAALHIQTQNNMQQFQRFVTTESEGHEMRDALSCANRLIKFPLMFFFPVEITY